MTSDRVIVVGGGPVGMMAAMYLATEGIPVIVVEAEHVVPDDLRASTFHPPTLDYLDRFDLTATLIERGRICPLWQFRDREEGPVATFDLGVLAGETKFPFRLQCEQWKLVRLLQERLTAMDDVTLLYGARAVDVHQDADSVTLVVEHERERQTIAGSYLIAADGAHSVIRRTAGIAFEGMTLPEVFLSLATTFPFHEHLPELADIAYLSDPDEWVALIRTPTLWRVVFPAPPSETDAEMMAPERVDARLQAVIAAPRPYEVIHKTAYRVHERVAQRYVHGRIALAGDAAHLNNPLGGMGMNGGIHDAMNLCEKLVAIRRGADPALLGRYERQRRRVAIETVQAQALRNRTILNERDRAKRQAYYDDLKATAADPRRHFQYVMRSSLLQSLRDLEAVH